jgi:hypothetical protein
MIHLLSGKEVDYDYSYMLPGFSPSDFQKIKDFSLLYQQLQFKKDEVILYFKLLENQKLIKKIKSKQLLYLNEERYTIEDNLLAQLLANCWTLQSHVSTYLEYVWKSIRKPTAEERIWYEHLWGESKSNQWFIECNNIRRDYQKENKNQLLKDTQDMIDWEKSQIRNTFDSIKEKYSKTIKDYVYFINPLLNVVYPEFLRNELSQNN